MNFVDFVLFGDQKAGNLPLLFIYFDLVLSLPWKWRAFYFSESQYKKLKVYYFLFSFKQFDLRNEILPRISDDSVQRASKLLFSIIDLFS